jgi:murein L,D-transpeptidase YafK
MRRRTAGLIVFFVTAVVAILGMAITSAFRIRPQPLPEDAHTDYILIEKKRHRLTLYFQHRKLRSYKIALGRGGGGPKLKAGDAKTPEGLYKIDAHNAHSKFHRALHIDYPSAKDAAMARRRGNRPGDGIEIHGLRNGFGWIGFYHRLIDWTNGCIATTDEEIEEIFRVVPIGTAVEIRG